MAFHLNFDFFRQTFLQTCLVLTWKRVDDLRGFVDVRVSFSYLFPSMSCLVAGSFLFLPSLPRR